MKNELLLCNFDRQNEINERILERNSPMCNIKNTIDIRPKSTKYALPIIEDNNLSNCFDLNEIKMQNENMFKKYSSNINLESELKNQHRSLNNNPKNDYIPSSNSTLYSSSIINSNNNNSELLYPYLFDENIVKENDNEIRNYNFINKLFNTDTRQELKK